jgi:hypothetical protein
VSVSCPTAFDPPRTGDPELNDDLADTLVAKSFVCVGTRREMEAQEISSRAYLEPDRTLKPFFPE